MVLVIVAIPTHPTLVRDLGDTVSKGSVSTVAVLATWQGTVGRSHTHTQGIGGKAREAGREIGKAREIGLLHPIPVGVPIRRLGSMNHRSMHTLLHHPTHPSHHLPNPTLRHPMQRIADCPVIIRYHRA